MLMYFKKKWSHFFETCNYFFKIFKGFWLFWLWEVDFLSFVAFITHYLQVIWHITLQKSNLARTEIHSIKNDTFNSQKCLLQHFEQSVVRYVGVDPVKTSMHPSGSVCFQGIVSQLSPSSCHKIDQSMVFVL